MANQLLDMDSVRAAFPVLADVNYLNTGTYGIMPEPALIAFQEAQAEFERRGVASTANLGGKANETRERLASLLGANSKEIAFTRDATDGINLVLSGMDWKPGDEVITTTEEHEAIIHPLLYLQSKRGIIVHRIEVSHDPAVMLARLNAVVSPRTRLVGLSHVTCESGTRLPGREICDWARERGILTLLDGAQALGAFEVNVRQLGCDFYTSNGHKWLCGPKGTGVFYGRLDRLVELTPAHVGAGSLAWVDINTGVAEPWASGLRFEYGTRAWAVYVGLGASLDWFDKLGWPNVHEHIKSLSLYAKGCLGDRSYLEVLSPLNWDASSGLVVFRAPGNVCFEIGRTLREKYHIVTRMIPHYNAVRITTAHFNTRDDVDKLVKGVDEIVRGH